MHVSLHTTRKRCLAAVKAHSIRELGFARHVVDLWLVEFVDLPLQLLAVLTGVLRVARPHSIRLRLHHNI